MYQSVKRTVTLYNFQQEHENLKDTVLDGLRKPKKELPAKLFYDKRGSELFEEITALPEYYLTRTEISILQEYRNEMVALMGEQPVLIEYGSGNSIKVHILLNSMKESTTYMPIDISESALQKSLDVMASRYPSFNIIALCADYTKSFQLPEKYLTDNRIVFFPGSTIGNFEPAFAKSFLQQTKVTAGSDGALLIGVDLKKDQVVLEAAYNDSQEVTATFNLNLLKRINQELDATFNLSQFEHVAFYNKDFGRIEMHLKSVCEQVVTVAGETVHFMEGETIHTENSYKYSVKEFQKLADDVGLTTVKVWTDIKNNFSMFYLKAEN